LIFEDLSFAIGAGEALVITGPNGSGKTSLLRLIAGLLPAAAGDLVLEGRQSDLAIGQYCHFVGHHEPVKPALTVEENLAFWAQYLGGGDVGSALARFGLAGLADLPGQLLSAGQKRRVALARLVVVPRVIWLLDEPTTALDSSSEAALTAVMEAHLAEGGMILAATHGALSLSAARRLDLGTAA
jgi:heme exporter protein A